MRRFDFHIHTKYLGCANETMEVAEIVRECARLGVESLAITDHLNTLDRLPDHRPIREDIERLEDPAPAVYFGVELNYTGCDEPFAYGEEVRDEMGFQFAIGGIHKTYLEDYDPEELVAIQHRHHLRTCENPLVSVLVHPYWFWQGEFTDRGWPWFDSMECVPESMAVELGDACRETGTALEINGAAIFCNPAYGDRFCAEYRDYLALIAERGAKFSFASDAHDISHLAYVREAWGVAEALGLSGEQIWRPSCAPLKGTSPV